VSESPPFEDLPGDDTEKSSKSTPLVSARGVVKTFPVQGGVFGRAVAEVRAVDGVDLDVYPGEVLGLVGESGCGKSTLGRVLLGMLPADEGSVTFDGVDVLRAKGRTLRDLRRQMQIVFQDPFSSLDPRATVGDSISEGLRAHGVPAARRRDRVQEVLDLVGLESYHARRYPHQFSGGQRQRVGIARALALNPRLVVADEPVSALDVSVQAQILNLMLDLQDQLRLTYLFVAHDLSVVKHVSDRVAVMYVGRIVETAPTQALFATPRHPYTEALLSAVPKPDPRLRARRIALEGEVADAANPPSGCYFHPRCPYAVEACRRESPALAEVAPGHRVSCHRARELTLRGVGD
jgi:oligopeptide/dipeptide ABC transporter ATP-binding protein